MDDLTTTLEAFLKLAELNMRGRGLEDAQARVRALQRLSKRSTPELVAMGRRVSP